jgi:glycosyltransferase involved in cell wall biosynthesis
MTRLSAIVITRNEERDLPACLESLAGVADQVVVVDSGSTDRTQDVARAGGAHFYEKAWEGFGPQKQYALAQAGGAWVLNLDADERLTPEGGKVLRAFLDAPPPGTDAYALPFQLYFLGRRLRFGGCFRERHVRLFRREKARYDPDPVHESVRVEGRTGFLPAPVRHESYRDFSEYLLKCETYTGLIARRKFSRGQRFHAWQNLRLAWEFGVRYVFKGGFLDGSAGFIYAALSAYYAWLKHVRLLDGEE